MDGGDLAVADADGFVHHLHHGREAVGGAGGGGHDQVPRRIVELFVHADDHIEHAIELHRRGDNDPLSAALQVARERLGRQELAGTLQHHIDTKIAPRDFGGLRMLGIGHAAVADADRAVVFGRDRCAPAALHTVEFQQMRDGRGATLDLVQMHDIEPIARARILWLPVRGTHRGAKRQTPDAAHAADAYPHGQRATACGSASSSMRAFRAMRSSETTGRLMKVSRRRRRPA